MFLTAVDRFGIPRAEVSRMVGLQKQNLNNLRIVKGRPTPEHIDAIYKALVERKLLTKTAADLERRQLMAHTARSKGYDVEVPKK